MTEFVAAFPAWVIREGERKGQPLSYQHYHYGLSYLRRKSARDELMMSNAYRMSKSSPEEYRDWRSDMRMIAGYD